MTRFRCHPAVIALLLLAGVLLSGCGGGPESSPFPELEQSLERGQALYDAHRYRDSYEEFARALVNSETEDNLYGQAVCYLALARCHQRLGEPRESLRMYAESERVMALMEREQPNINRRDLHILLGRFNEMQAEIYMSRRQYDRAAEALDRADTHFEAAE